jgi:hypothetical protein
MVWSVGDVEGLEHDETSPPGVFDPDARCVILVDLPSWPSAHRPHAWRQPPFTAPTLDLNVAFHRPTSGRDWLLCDRPTSGRDWLLCDGAAPLSTGGLFGWTAGSRLRVASSTPPAAGNACTGGFQGWLGDGREAAWLLV